MTTKNKELALPEPSVALMLQNALASIQQGEITTQHTEVLGKMMDLFERDEKRRAEKEFNVAFVAFQQALPRINVTKAVTKGNGQVLYRFAPLEDIEEIVKPIALANGFTYSFTEGEQQPDRITKVFTIFHVGGHSKSNAFTVRRSAPPNTTDSQADGSTHSYAKRGAFCDGWGIVVDHDDDARMIGKPIGKALAEDLQARVKATNSDEVAFLKYAGVKCWDDMKPQLTDYMEISGERYESLDGFLLRKEGKLKSGLFHENPQR